MNPDEHSPGTRDNSKNVDVDRLTPWEHKAARVLSTIAGLLIIGVISLLFIDPSLAWPLLLFMVINLLFGREISIAVGSAMDLPPWLMIGVNVTQSVSIGLLVYLAVLHILAHHPDGLAARWARKVQHRADRHRKTIDRFGPLGLFFLMLMPFFAHPFVAAVSGRLSGLSLKQMIVPILAATTVMATFWAYSMTALIRVLREVWQGFPIVVVAVITTLALAASFFLYNKKEDDTQQSDAQGPTRRPTSRGRPQRSR